MELSERPLKAELAAIAECAEPSRTARLAVRHWGWDGSGGEAPDPARRDLPARPGDAAPRPGDLASFRTPRRR